MMLGNGLQGTLLGVRATLEGYSTFSTGIMMSGYFVGMVVGSIFAPRLVQRVGHIRVFAALASLASIAILIHGLHINIFTWSAMRVITGISYAGLYVVSESWLNDRASNETRGQVLSVYMLVSTLGLGVGQFFLNFSSPAEIDLFILISIIVSFGLIPILLTARSAPTYQSAGMMSIKELYRASPLAVVSHGLVGVAHGTIFGLGAVYAANEFHDVEKISLFMACFLFGSLLLQWPAGWLADHINRRIIMIGLCALSIIACMWVLIVPMNNFWYFMFIVLLGGASMPMYSLVIAYANDRLEPEQIISASGSLLMVAGLGLSTGPIIMGYIMTEFGNSYYFVGIAAIFACLLGFVLYRMKITDAIAPAEQSPIIAAGAIGTPVALYNAPDAEEFVEALIQDELHRLDEEAKEREL